LDIRENYDEILVVPHAQRRIAQNRSLVDYLAGFDQALEPRPRQLRQMVCQHAIEALPGIGLGSPDHGLGVVAVRRHRKLNGCAPSKSWLLSWACCWSWVLRLWSQLSPAGD